MMKKNTADRYDDIGALVSDLCVIQNKTVTNKVVEEEVPEPSISVLAFTNMSTDPVSLYINHISG